ncbi:TPR repeat-containing protein [Trichuris trichiura]|uniref:TPR repeat-containing protein n=1 Tax=Trichuris trichiura TaxID=36087 RepID=A0A077ZQX7_TRITR|nr:TPR repeat-containing protein [Trichuris trichiura]
MDDIDDQRSMVSGQCCLSFRNLRTGRLHPLSDLRHSYPYDISSLSRNSLSSIRGAKTFADSKFLLSNILEADDGPVLFARSNHHYPSTTMGVSRRLSQSGDSSFVGALAGKKDDYVQVRREGPSGVAPAFLILASIVRSATST